MGPPSFRCDPRVRTRSFPLLQPGPRNVGVGDYWGSASHSGWSTAEGERVRGSGAPEAPEHVVRYDSAMELSNEHETSYQTDRTGRIFPTWIRVSVIGVAAILVCAVVGGMFLY